MYDHHDFLPRIRAQYLCFSELELVALRLRNLDKNIKLKGIGKKARKAGRECCEGKIGGKKAKEKKKVKRNTGKRKKTLIENKTARSSMFQFPQD